MCWSGEGDPQECVWERSGEWRLDSLAPQIPELSERIVEQLVVNFFGVFSQRGKTKVFTECVFVPRHRLFSRLWCLCACVFVCLFFVV